MAVVVSGGERKVGQTRYKIGQSKWPWTRSVQKKNMKKIRKTSQDKKVYIKKWSVVKIERGRMIW